MPEELNIVTQLAIILVAAGVFTVVSKALKQPLILGYIIAGFIVGPHLGIFPQFSAESVHEWSEIGIIFLLFSLGLEFSFKKLIKIGSSALITAGVKCIGMFVVGMIVGPILGWTTMESIFLGGLLSMSSTTIIIKAYDDMGLKKKPYSTLIFGSLVFEDLIAVLLLVLLSTIAVSNKFAGAEMLLSLGKLAFFIVLWFLVGIYLIPTILKKAHDYLSDEILLITGIGLCLGMVVLANLVGFSSALGAFVMGSILAETLEGERIERLTVSIKNLFGAIFFVSVGMMVDPVVIGQHWGVILVISLATICGILIFSTGGALLAGQGLDSAVHAGFSLAQLGEFAFIIAGLGTSLGVMRDFIYPVIIAVSVITTFTTPYMIKAAEPALGFIRKRVPANILERIDRKSDSGRNGWNSQENDWRQLLVHYFLRIGLYGVILIAIMIGSRVYLQKVLTDVLPGLEDGGFWHNLIHCAITVLVMSPFLYGLAIENNALGNPAKKLLKENKENRWPLLVLLFMRVGIAVCFLVIEISTHFVLGGPTLAVLIVSGVVIAFYMKTNRHKGSRLEKRFMANLNAKENLEKEKKVISSSVRDKLNGYDVHIERISVSPDFRYAGLALRDMPFRHTSGVNIIKVTRGTQDFLIPSGDVRIFPGDILLAVGTTSQLDSFITLMEENSAPHPSSSDSDQFVVESVQIGEGSALKGKRLRDTDMRTHGCMVLSVLREEELITNPSPDFIFEPGDMVWLAGLVSSVKHFE